MWACKKFKDGKEHDYDDDNDGEKGELLTGAAVLIYLNYQRKNFVRQVLDGHHNSRHKYVQVAMRVC